MAEKFDQDTLNFLMENNKINDEKFNEFHKKMFNEMLEQSLILACDLLKKKGEVIKFQVINKSMQTNSVRKVQFSQLNNKRFYFCNGIVSIPYGHPLLENLRKKKLKYRHSKKKLFKKKKGKIFTRRMCGRKKNTSI